jgi:hypothetical protein
VGTTVIRTGGGNSQPSTGNPVSKKNQGGLARQGSAEVRAASQAVPLGRQASITAPPGTALPAGPSRPAIGSGSGGGSWAAGAAGSGQLNAPSSTAAPAPPPRPAAPKA